MQVPPEKTALREITKHLKELLEVPAGLDTSEGLCASSRVDAEIRVAGRLFLVEWKASGDAAAVGAGVRQLELLRTGGRSELESGGREHEVLVMAVPFMGEAGQRICSEHGVSWLDLSGNARIEAPGIHIRVEGKENQFKRRGRPPSPFAPKSSRIARWLLIHPGEYHAQREIAIATEMGEGFTSRIVRRLEQLGLIERNDLGEVRAPDPRLLLRAWAEQYDFERHHILRGHVVARSGDELLRQASGALSDARIRHAATGLAGAWLLTHFAGYRTATCYVGEIPDQDLLDALGFHQDEQGANLWLVLPKDAGVFHGLQVKDSIPCVHPLQVWLDLKGHPERSEEAAQHLEKTLLDWGSHA